VVAQDAREYYLSNVVAISVDNALGETIEEGYGLIVGRQDTVLWVVTAAHVLYATGSDGLPSPSTLGTVTATWVSSPAKHKLAGRAIFPQGLKDIVFMPIEAPITQQFQDTWLHSVLAHSPKPGDELWLAGKGGTIAVAGDGFVVGSDASSVSALDVVRGELGQSGAPIIARQGIVGLYRGLASGKPTFRRASSS
jgi:hypothetical protein